MKIFLLDKHGLLKTTDTNSLRSAKVEVIASFEELPDAVGVAFFANKIAAREYFGTNDQKLIKYQGDRFEDYQYGATLPDFDRTIPERGPRVQRFFSDAFARVDEYNKSHGNAIKYAVYNIDEMVLPKERFVEYFDSFLRALDDFRAA